MRGASHACWLLIAFTLPVQSAWSSQVGGTMDPQRIRKVLKVPPACQTLQTPGPGSSKPVLLEIWCDGKLAYGFEDLNLDEKIDREESRRGKETLILEDRNFDGRTDLEKSLKTEGSTIRAVERDDPGFLGKFTVRRYRMPATEPGGFPLSFSNDPSHESCPDHLKKVLQDEAEEGLQCLGRLSTMRTASMRGKLQNILRNTANPVKIVCRHYGPTGSKTVAEATMPEQPSYPRVSFNLDHAEINDPNAYAGTGKGVAFHEFLHLPGERHEWRYGQFNRIDPVVTCNHCCFGNEHYLAPTGGVEDLRGLACDLCSGKSRDVGAFNAMMYLWGKESVGALFAPGIQSLGTTTDSRIQRRIRENGGWAPKTVDAPTDLRPGGVSPAE